MKLITVLLLMLLTFSAKAADNNLKNQPSETIAKKQKILLLGDSLAEGMAKEFVKKASAADYAKSVQAKGGTRCKDWSGKIEKLMINFRPGLTIISLGTNDAGPENVEDQRQYVRNIRDIAKKYNSKILWILPRKLPKKFKGQENIRKIIKEEINTDVFDSSHLDLPMSNDKIHPIKNGYDAWFCSIWNYLLERRIVSN